MESTDWKLTFSEAGDYTITFSLIDLTTQEIIITDSVNITVDAQ